MNSFTMLADSKDNKKYVSRSGQGINKVRVINGRPVNPYKKKGKGN